MKKDHRGEVSFHAKFDVNLYKRLGIVSIKAEVSMREMVRRAVKRYVKKMEKEHSE